MATPGFIIVGRIRKAHGIRGEVVVEPITDEPEAVFASGSRVFSGTATGDISRDGAELHIVAVREFNEGLLVSFTEIPDRTQAELWRGRYLLLPLSEVPAPADDEVYVHELLGMRVQLASGELVGTVAETYDLPHGLALDVRRAPPRESETVMVLHDEHMVANVDKGARVITITPPDGLLE